MKEMKNIIKIFSLLLFVSGFISCDKSDDLKYNPTPENGWIQFTQGTPSAIGAFQGTSNVIDLDVDIQVPTTSQDLTINYSLVPVSGLDPNTVFSNSGTSVAPAGQTSYAGPDNNTGIDYSYLNTIKIDLNEALNADLNGETMVFDVVLTGTSSSGITVGLSGETFPISTRITINPSLDDFVGTYDVSENFTDGVNAPFGLSDFFGENYQVELARMPDDPTASKFVITNSAGFDVYFIGGTDLTFLGDGGLFFDDGNDPNGFPVVGLFRIFEFENSSYDYDNLVLQADGPLDTFGPYQFTLTKQ